MSRPEAMRAEVALTPQCVATGTYRLYNSRGDLQGAGQFADDRREGVWTFWDSAGTKIVELTYVRGAREGPYAMWYGAFAFPSSKGRLKVSGAYSADRENGAKAVWWPEGSRRCEITLDRGEVTRAECWAKNGEASSAEEATAMAREQSQADAEYLHTLDSVVEDSLKERCREASIPGPLPKEKLRE